MARDNKPTFGRSSLFSPTVVRRIINSAGSIQDKSAATLSGTLPGTSSFRYDIPGTGLKSTQQVSLDWQDFTTHTFFNSAEAKVNVAFDEIINHYPFDGSMSELAQFEDGLTGFENYTFERFPKWRGFLHFSGTKLKEKPKFGFSANLGTRIQVNDFAGSLFPDLSQDRTGKSILDPGVKSISFEFDLYVPTGSASTGNQIILQKLNSGDNAQGITVALSASHAYNDKPELVMMIASGSAIMSASMDLNDKGTWSHVCAVFDRAPSKNYIELFLDSVPKSTSNPYDIKGIDFKVAPLLIGSGTAQVTGSSDAIFSPQQTLSGAIDELRIFHDARSQSSQVAYAEKNIFPTATDELKLYFRFNEVTGTYVSNDVTLDSSGMSLHAKVSNFTSSIRERLGVEIPLTLERDKNNPVLFPDFSGVTSLNASMLADAKEYDANNPNLITKLIPQHYLLEASEAEGFTTENADVGDAYSYYTGESIPGGGKIGSPQLVAALLYTWAKFFDELKVYIDQFSNLLHVDYEDVDNIPAQFLPFLANYYGFPLPNQFANTSLPQWLEGENLGADQSFSSNSLQYVQNQIWRRVLINLNEVIKSKGTIYAIKVLMRSMGIDPDNNFRFREYGGSRTRDLTFARLDKSEVSTLLDMSGSLKGYGTVTIDPQSGAPTNTPLLQSDYLSGSRIEVGYPPPAASTTFIEKKKFYPHGVSNNPNDGLFTSGSWTFESVYRFGPIKNIADRRHPLTQSLARICVTGSQTQSSPSLVANLVAFASGSLSHTGSLRLYARPGVETTLSQSPLLCFSLNGIDIFDGNPWYIAFGRERNDQFGSVASSSYFIRAGRQSFGELITYKAATKYFLEEVGTNPGGAWTKRDDGFNASGSFITIGEQRFSTAGNKFLNSATLVPDSTARWTMFSGRVGHMHFWSRAVTQAESEEHVRNFRSLGVKDPTLHFNFEKVASGAFGRLRMNASTDQPVTQSDSSGQIVLTDFSQAGTYVTGSGFQSSARVIRPQRFDFSMLDPKFDEGAANNKIRIRSWLSYDNVLKHGGEVAPLYEILPSEKPNDDTRFAIEISSVQALNEDMVNIFSTLESLDNVLGDPALLFAPEYYELQNLREIYFNRLTDKVRLKSFFEFFKWFDTSMGDIIERLIPSKTNFLGMNYIIESHMLERAKFNYHYSDVYLGENNRHGLKGTILMRQLVGQMKRF